MKFTTLPLILLLFTSLSFSQKAPEIPFGHPEALEFLEQVGPAPQAEVSLDMEPSFKYDRADHVANGVAMRNRTSGTIALRGVPTDARVIQSLLYWNFSDGNEKGADTMPVLFNGNLIRGRKTADNPDPCWGMTANHTYVADVTAFTNQSGHANQDYSVVLVFDEATDTSGVNPWANFAPQNVRPEGASLIVVFESDATTGPLTIYDALSNTTFFNSFSATVANPGPLNPGGADLFTMLGADGQLGGGYSLGATNETTFFNGVQIAGPPVTNSDWDGSDGWPLVQLWDTHTHIVSLTGATSQINYNTGGDCLVPVAFVLDDK
ncbi:MAG: DUF3344 domain-containing protein [Acidobacteriota bacterium]|nr:DUF3344 domain-containing protein [Acidobacteriota bacterium]